MDILRKELDAFYKSQHLNDEILYYNLLSHLRYEIEVATGIDDDCRVITDAAADRCYIYGGALSYLLGLTDIIPYVRQFSSSDEDDIYNRIHPEDLVDKRMLEYEYFKYVDSKYIFEKTDYKATCRVRIKDRNGRYIYVLNSTRIVTLSPKGKVWLILCCYDLSPAQYHSEGIEPRIINCSSGEIIEIHLKERRAGLLTKREKEILNLIKEGKASKQIAAILGISIHTVNRHRQNIIEKLSVSNTVEAITAASLMRLL